MYSYVPIRVHSVYLILEVNTGKAQHIFYKTVARIQFLLSSSDKKINIKCFVKLGDEKAGSHMHALILQMRCAVIMPHLKLFIPFPNKPLFLLVCSASLLKTLPEKEKLLLTSNFSFSLSVFYTFRELSAIFIKFKIVICKLCQFGRV